MTTPQLPSEPHLSRAVRPSLEDYCTGCGRYFADGCLCGWPDMQDPDPDEYGPPDSPEGEN